MRNRNVLVLGGAVLLIVLVLLVSLIPQSQREVHTGAVVEPAVTETPALAEETVVPAPEETKAAADAYLLVTAAGILYEPIAIYEEGEYTLRREDGIENVIHVTPDSVYMKSSTCDNQDCVLQGTVTLENMDERVLGNMIICLPNEVTLELYTPEGIAQVIMQNMQE